MAKCRVDVYSHHCSTIAVVYVISSVHMGVVSAIYIDHCFSWAFMIPIFSPAGNQCMADLTLVWGGGIVNK